MDLFLISMMFAHWVSDFLLQNNWMALNKSKNAGILAIHAFVYAFGMFIWACLTSMSIYAIWFFVITFPLHFIVDYCSSKATRKAWEKAGATRLFFDIIGFDQFLHFCCLYGTLWYLGVVK